MAAEELVALTIRLPASQVAALRARAAAECRSVAKQVQVELSAPAPERTGTVQSDITLNRGHLVPKEVTPPTPPRGGDEDAVEAALAANEFPDQPVGDRSYSSVVAEWSTRRGDPPDATSPRTAYRGVLDRIAKHIDRESAMGLLRYRRLCVQVLVDFLASVRPDDPVTPGIRKQLLSAVATRTAPELLNRMWESAERGAATRDGDTLRQLVNYALAVSDNRGAA